jgi:hypothetical protein
MNHLPNTSTTPNYSFSSTFHDIYSKNSKRNVTASHSMSYYYHKVSRECTNPCKEEKLAGLGKIKWRIFCKNQLHMQWEQPIRVKMDRNHYSLWLGNVIRHIHMNMELLNSKIHTPHTPPNHIPLFYYYHFEHKLRYIIFRAVSYPPLLLLF